MRLNRFATGWLHAAHVDLRRVDYEHAGHVAHGAHRGRVRQAVRRSLRGSSSRHNFD